MTIDLEAARAETGRYLAATADTVTRVRTDCLEDIVAAAGILTDSLRAGGKVLICGNGGSAADA